jgi:hypothetical protein
MPRVSADSTHAGRSFLLAAEILTPIRVFVKEKMRCCAIII